MYIGAVENGFVFPGAAAAPQTLNRIHVCVGGTIPGYKVCPAFPRQ